MPWKVPPLQGKQNCCQNNSLPGEVRGSWERSEDTAEKQTTEFPGGSFNALTLSMGYARPSWTEDERYNHHNNNKYCKK